MKYRTIEHKGKQFVRIESSEVIIVDVSSALDLMASIRYESGIDRIIIDSSAFDERFFDLSTRLAGDILQKFVTYQMKLGIIGDFRSLKSKSLQAFIYESNKSSDIVFALDEKQAVEHLSR